jgi:diguanylate cyclase
VVDGLKSDRRPGGASSSVAGHPGGAQGGGPSITFLVSSGRGRASNGKAARGPRPALGEPNRPAPHPAPGPGGNGNGRLRLYLQPTVWLGGGQVAGFDASVRPEHPVATWHADGPAEDNELEGWTEDESSDSAVVLGGWLVAEATRTLGRWRTEGLTTEMVISAGVPASSLRSSGFAEAVLNGIDDNELPASDLVLRLPRHAFKTERETVRLSIAALHARGVGVGVDDLDAADARASVPGLLVSQLIINPSLIASLGRDRARTALVSELASLARLLGAVSVADGIETEAQALAAHEAGCRLGRGTYFGEPRPASEIERELRAARPHG